MYAPEIEQFQNNCRDVMGLNGSANTCKLLRDGGRLCVLYTILNVLHSLLFRMEHHRYPRNCYIMLKRLDDIVRVNWVSRMKGLLFSYWFGYAWLSQEGGDINWFIHQFRLLLSDCMRHSWHDDINTSYRCELYKEVKSLLEPEI